MKITNIKQVNDVGCNDCPWPTCPEPVKECQSILVTPCGYAMPEHEDVPAEQRCIIFKKVTIDFTQHDSGDPPTGGETNVSTDDTHRVTVYEKLFQVTTPTPPTLPERECIERLASYDETATSVRQMGPEGGELTTDTTAVINMHSAWNSPCAGTYTYTDNLDPDNNFTDDYPFCSPDPIFSINDEWSYASGVFTLVVVDGNLTETTKITYSEPVTLADLTTEIDARISLYGDTRDWPGSECESSVEFDFGYPDPPEGEEPDPEADPVCRQVSEATKARYNYQVPAGFSTVGLPRTTFEVTWDEYFFPGVWDLWDEATGVYEQWEKDHAEWIEGGSVGPEPVEPPAPGDEPEARPELIAEREWVWDGTAGDDESPWFILDLPEDTEEPGQTRQVNLAVNCWKSTRYGRKPTFHGEIYSPPPPEEP